MRVSGFRLSTTSRPAVRVPFLIGATLVAASLCSLRSPDSILPLKSWSPHTTALYDQVGTTRLLNVHIISHRDGPHLAAIAVRIGTNSPLQCLVLSRICSCRFSIWLNLIPRYFTSFTYFSSSLYIRSFLFSFKFLLLVKRTTTVFSWRISIGFPSPMHLHTQLQVVPTPEGSPDLFLIPRTSCHLQSHPASLMRNLAAFSADHLTEGSTSVVRVWGFRPPQNLFCKRKGFHTTERAK